MLIGVSYISAEGLHFSAFHYNGIFLIFIRVTLQTLGAPKSAVFRTLQLLHTTPCTNHAVVFTPAANATLNGQGICDLGYITK